MSTRRTRGSRQPELFARSTRPVIALEMNHRLVRLTEELDWTALEELVEAIRRAKLKNAAGRPPHLRALIGAVVLRATRRMTYRETEDQIRHYAPARYLCGLTETDWTPDANTIQDFEQRLGEEGMRLLNEQSKAARNKLTAQMQAHDLVRRDEPGLEPVVGSRVGEAKRDGAGRMTVDRGAFPRKRPRGRAARAAQRADSRGLGGRRSVPEYPGKL